MQYLSSTWGSFQSQSCPQISSEDFKILDLFINNNLTINPTSHNRHLHQLRHQSLPLAKVKDSVVISFESTTSHQVSPKTTSWRSMSTIPSMTSVHHCLKNVKKLGQHSLIQEQWHHLLLSHLFLTSPSRRSQRHSPASMVRTSKSWASSTLPSIITGRVIIHVNFLIVEDVKNPIVSLVSMRFITQSSASSSSWKREVHSSATSAQSTSSPSPNSRLCIRFGPSRSCSKSSSQMVRPSVCNLRQAISIQHHCQDRRQNHFRFKENHLGRRVKKISLNRLRFLIVSRSLPRLVQQKENFMNSLIFRSGHGARFVKKDQNGHVQLTVMAYVDDLVISGSAQMVRDLSSTSTCSLQTIW